MPLGQRDGEGGGKGVTGTGGVDGFDGESREPEFLGTVIRAPDGEIAFPGGDDGGAEIFVLIQQVLGGFLGGLAVCDPDAGEGFGFVLVGAQDGDEFSGDRRSESEIGR